MAEQETTRSYTKPILIGCGLAAVIAALLCVAAGLGGTVWLATGPEGGVRMSNELEPYALELIEEHNLLQESEEIIAYYDATVSLNGSEAAILTTKRVMYYKDGRTTSIELADIKDVEHRYESISGDIIEVISNSGQRLRIEVAPFNQGESFYNALIDAWEASTVTDEP